MITTVRVIFAALLIASPSVLAQVAVPLSEDDLEAIAARREERKPEEPKDVQLIDDAISRNSLQEANKLATGVIERELGTNPQLDSYIKSAAFLRRANILEKLGRDRQEIDRQLTESAKLGNLDAVEQLVEEYVESAKGRRPSDAMLKGVDIDEILEVGLHLGDDSSLKAVVDGFGKRVRSPRELVFYQALLASRSPPAVRELAVRYDLASILSEYAYVGGPLSRNPSGTYSRDLLATLFAEGYFRYNWAMRLSGRMPDTLGDQHQDLTLREGITVSAWAIDRTGLATLFTFLTEESDTPFSAKSTAAQIAQQASPGSTINVRCGALAHTAVVFKVDRQLDKLFLIDPLYHFWQPSHNFCITSFNLAHYKYGYYLSQLRLSEVAKILVAVETLGTYQPPEQVYRLDKSYPNSEVSGTTAVGKSRVCTATGDSSGGFLGHHLTPLLNRDLFGMFSLEETTRRAENSETAVVYMSSSSPTFRGDLILVARIDQNDCAQSFSLFLRRLFISGYTGPVAEENIGRFLNEVLNSRQRRSLKSPAVGIPSVYSGKEQAGTLQLPGATLRMQNVASETYAKWLRVDIW